MALHLLASRATVRNPAVVVVEISVIVVVSSVLVLTLALHPAVFAARASAWHQLPPNIRTTDDLRPIIEDLLARSATLREQSARISIARQTWISITLSTARFPWLTRARSTARRYHTGLLVVDVELPSASQDFAELLAHELEHVTEFIDGVDFKKLAKKRSAGVVQCGSDGSFETERAQTAGRKAKVEIETRPGATPPPR
jgi:hypothetical protein